MKSSEAMAGTARVIALPLKGRPQRSELEFLPAALEIIETPASPLGRAIAGTIIGFLCAALVWATFSEVDIIATTEGRIIPTGKSKIIQPFETGVVRAILVGDGTVVHAGDVLVELDPTSDAADETRLSYDLAQDHLDVARLRALLDQNSSTFSVVARDIDPKLAAVARLHMQAQAAEHAAKLETIDRQIAGKQAEVLETRAAIEKLNASLPLVTEQRDIRKSLLANQYGSRITYLQVEQQVSETEHGVIEQQQHLPVTQEALAALEKQRLEVDADYRRDLLADLAKAEMQASEHNQDMTKATQRRDLRMLKAPVDGTVQQVTVHTIGGIVTPAQQLMVVVPKGTELEIEAALANKDIGFVHKGQDVEIKVEAFTFTRYGLLHGTVSSLSQDAVTDDAPNDKHNTNDGNRRSNDSDEQRRQAGQPTYVAHVAVAATGINTEDGFTKLEPGMAVTAEIKTGKRSIISYLLSPLSRFRQEGMRER